MISIELPSAKVLKIAGAVVLASAVLLAEVALYRKGYGAGKASNEAAVVAIQGKLTVAETQARVLSDKLAQQNDAVEDARRLAVESQQVAQVAEAAADATKRAADQRATDWQKKLAEATAKPQCAVLSTPLCDDVMDY